MERDKYSKEAEECKRHTEQVEKEKEKYQRYAETLLNSILGNSLQTHSHHIKCYIFVNAWVNVTDNLMQ